MVAQPPAEQTLPSNPIDRAVVDTPGGPVGVRGITHREATDGVRFATPNGKQDVGLLNVWLVACGCDVTVGAAEEWLKITGVSVAQMVISKINELSGTTAEAGNA